ncbi:MAG TPA: hypothetical protein VK760_09320 [Candidatus Acidoferrales bacterium]|jgi:hypothetical protein|nr:hypothetical protein [Candidatus Acidoferrales bacterium]
MKRSLALAAALVATASLYACGGSRSVPTPTLPDAAARGLAAKATPFPLPKQTPDWKIVEKPAPWDYASTGPDRSACTAKDGLTYRVGPGQPYPLPRNVPWLRLLPCDTVLIYPAPTPYDDVVYIASRGRVHKAITVSGVLDAKGHRPIFDGSHAVTSAKEGVDSYLLCLGMIIVGKPSVQAIPQQVYGYKPGYLIIENLEVRNAFGKYPGSNQPVYTCTDTKGAPHPWGEFVSGLYFNPAEHVLIKNNYLHRDGLGAFVNSLNQEYGQSRDFYVTDNVLENNGNGEASQHNYYFELVGERVIHNYFGPPIAHTQGENIKDRSVCVEYADNYIDSGNNLIAFRDPQSNGAFEWKQRDAFGTQCASQLYVHGNTFVARGPTEFQQISTIQGFGDGVVEDAPQNNRFGALYFYNNVVLAIADRDNYGLKVAPIFQNGNVGNGPTTFYALNNLFYSMPATAHGGPPGFAACYWQQFVDFTKNWDSRKMEVKQATKTDGNEAVGTPCDGSGMSGIAVSSADPRFVDAAHGNFHLQPSSPYYKLDAPLPSAVTQRKLLPDGVAYPSHP